MSTAALRFNQQALEFNKQTQEANILAHLKSGKAITPLEALNLYSCFRLGGRIYDLKKQGHKIESKMVDVGNGKHVAQYRLITSA